MIKEVRLPEISEKVDSGDVIEVLVSIGDIIEEEQSIVELETDKATFEVPSPAAGKVVEINVDTGQNIKVGQVIIKVDTEVTEAAPAEKPSAPVEDKKAEETAPIEVPGPKAEKEAVVKKRGETRIPEVKAAPSSGTVAAAPSVRQLARELGIDITSVRGSGPAGRVSAEDVKDYTKRRITGAGPAPSGEVLKPLPDFSQWGEIERQAMTNIRRIIAENTGYAWNMVPHVTQYDEADITMLEEFRKEYGVKVKEAGGKLTVSSILLKVCASALKAFPKFNASLDMDSQEIIYKKYFNIGVAVDTERGLLVPVIRDVYKKSILQLSIELTGIAEKTRNKKITPEDLEGGSFTISNLGGIGGTDFSPIVYWPQVAILGVSRAVDKPVYLDGQIQKRLMLPLSLSYDHRIIDGADGARFLRWIVEALEQPFILALKE